MGYVASVAVQWPVSWASPESRLAAMPVATIDRRPSHCCAASDSIERRILTLKRQIPFPLCSSFTHERKSKAEDGRTRTDGKTHARPTPTATRGSVRN